MIIVYGIPNCDTVKKARAWFAAQAQAHHFHDFKTSGVPENLLPEWLAALGNARLINRQGTTWRKLDASAQAAASDDAGAMALMVAQPSVIKRPVVDWADGEVTVGFDAAGWARKLQM
jgi:arsenate reductase (glutaredoxin)